jgi:hypothetical protein
MPEKLTLRYDDEFILEIASLPSGVEEALYSFLERLTADPDSPDLQAEPTSRGLWGAQFTRGYSVYWKVEREASELTTLATGRPTLIKICNLTIKALQRPHRNSTVRS